jgi:hypothetical protein
MTNVHDSSDADMRPPQDEDFHTDLNVLALAR